MVRKNTTITKRTGRFLNVQDVDVRRSETTLTTRQPLGWELALLYIHKSGSKVKCSSFSTHIGDMSDTRVFCTFVFFPEDS